MKRIPWRDLYAGLLAAFFVVGGSLNIFASPAVIEDYQNWGYPAWFHYVTGVLEWTSAVLIGLPFTRLAGSALAGAVMAAAAGTVLLHGEYSHAITPLTVLVLVCLNGWLTLRGNKSSRPE